MTVYYVPAGAEAYDTYTQINIKNQKSPKEFTEFGRLYKRWVTKTKEVSLIKSSKRSSVYSGSSYDLSVPIYTPKFLKGSGIDIALANPIHNANFDKSAFTAAKLKVILDSGGFQLLSSVIDFVDPNDVIARYNKGADIGMPLDLPVVTDMEPYFFDIASKLMKDNDEYILNKVKKGVEVALISHGSTLDARKRRLDVLDRPAKVVAIAGLNMKAAPGKDKYYSQLENLMYVITRYRDSAEYFHVLGVTSKVWFFIYSYLDAIGYVKNIGADSVSHRLDALTGTYSYPDYTKPIKLTKDLQVFSYPQCPCPVCSSVQDLRILQEAYLLESHNVWARNQQVKFTRAVVQAYIEKQVTLEEAMTLAGVGIKSTQLALMLRYIDEIADTGKFKTYQKGKSSNSLFGTANQAPALTTTEQKNIHAHLTKVVKNYENFYNKGYL